MSFVVSYLNFFRVVNSKEVAIYCYTLAIGEKECQRNTWNTICSSPFPSRYSGEPRWYNTKTTSHAEHLQLKMLSLAGLRIFIGKHVYNQFVFTIAQTGLNIKAFLSIKTTVLTIKDRKKICSEWVRSETADRCCHIIV